MHIAVTVVIVTTIAYSFILTYGYLKQEKMQKLDNFILEEFGDNMYHI